MRFLSYLLIASGLATMIVIASPGLVLMGLIGGILPGMILTLMPMVFFASLTFAAIWIPLRRLVESRIAAITAVMMVAGLAFLIPKALNRPIHETVAKERATDFEPVAPIAISGVVRLERVTLGRTDHSIDARPMPCDDMCHALLFTPDVDAVIVSPDDPAPLPFESAMFRRASSSQLLQEGAAPPSGIRSWGKWPNLEDLRADWQAQLGDHQRIVRDVPDQGPRFIIREVTKRHFGALPKPLSLAPRPVTWVRLEIEGAKGETLLRRTRVSSSPLYVPLFTFPTNGFRQLGIARQEHHEVGGFDSVLLLRQRTNIVMSPMHRE